MFLHKQQVHQSLKLYSSELFKSSTRVSAPGEIIPQFHRFFNMLKAFSLPNCVPCVPREYALFTSWNLFGVVALIAVPTSRQLIFWNSIFECIFYQNQVYLSATISPLKDDKVQALYGFCLHQKMFSD